MEKNSLPNEFSHGSDSSVRNEGPQHDRAVFAASDRQNGVEDNSHSPDAEVPLQVTLAEGEAQITREHQSNEEIRSTAESKDIAFIDAEDLIASFQDLCDLVGGLGVERRPSFLFLFASYHFVWASRYKNWH